MQDAIKTGLGIFDKEKFNALLNIRATALNAIREFLNKKGFTEVTTSSLVNIAGSCENPYASFSLNYYGRKAHLSQSSQLQLEALVIRLKRNVYSVTNSFREENFDDPESSGRRLSEFTLIEPEKAYFGMTSNEILNDLISEQEKIIKLIISEVLQKNSPSLKLLGGNIQQLEIISNQPFLRINYDEAIQILNRNKSAYVFGDDLGILEERQILKQFDNQPVFITHYPAKIKFFNMKKTPDGDRVYNVDLLTPRLGETIGGAVREESGDKIKQQLLNSQIAEFMKINQADILKPFEEYLKLFEQEVITSRGGFGIGFERLIAFLLNSNDILQTISYRTMQPQK